MKIPLRITDIGIELPSVISSPQYRLGFVRTSFIVDTGSPQTFISEGDALRLNLPLNKLKFREHMRMAGSVFEVLEMRNVGLYVKTDEERSEKIELPYIGVARGTKKDSKSIQIAQSFPNILGIDFLKQNKLALYFNPSKNIAYLEKSL